MSENILKEPTTNITGKILAVIPPSRNCDVCGATVAVQHNGIFFHHIIVISSGGDPSLPAFQCPDEEHFVCSVKCLGLAGHACLDEHMLPIARDIENRLKGDMLVEGNRIANG